MCCYLTVRETWFWIGFATCAALVAFATIVIISLRRQLADARKHLEGSRQ